jgi:hypothetical protein
VPEDSDAWDKMLSETLVERAAAHHLCAKGERFLPRPGNADGYKGEHPNDEVRRVNYWQLLVIAEVGKFLTWCKKAGVLREDKKRARLHVPEEPFAGAIEALSFEREQDGGTPLSEEEAAALFEVSVADLPRALHNYTVGKIYCFFEPVIPDEVKPKLPA